MHWQAETDNSVIRELEYLQASMLWLDIGAFCGYKRKMEIAESSLQALVTVWNIVVVSERDADSSGTASCR